MASGDIEEEVVAGGVGYVGGVTMPPPHRPRPRTGPSLIERLEQLARDGEAEELIDEPGTGLGYVGGVRRPKPKK